MKKSTKPIETETVNEQSQPTMAEELTQVLDNLSTDDNEVIDGKTKEYENITDADIEHMAVEIMSDDDFGTVYGTYDDVAEPVAETPEEEKKRKEYEDKILTERAINKMKRQAAEKKAEEERQLEFLSWYYKYQLEQYRSEHGFEMEGKLKRKLRKQIVKQWESGKLKRLYASNLN